MISEWSSSVVGTRGTHVTQVCRPTPDALTHSTMSLHTHGRRAYIKLTPFLLRLAAGEALASAEIRRWETYQKDSSFLGDTDRRGIAAHTLS